MNNRLPTREAFAIMLLINALIITALYFAIKAIQ